MPLKSEYDVENADEIKSELEQIGFDVIKVANVKHRLTKAPLSMFYVNLKQNDHNKEIYRIHHILHTKQKVEPTRKKERFRNAINVRDMDIRTKCATMSQVP